MRSAYQPLHHKYRPQRLDQLHVHARVAGNDVAVLPIVGSVERAHQAADKPMPNLRNDRRGNMAKI